ncbi:MAG: Clp amino terminal protein [Gemmataceae bacterium]|nr:Clp amino terminal protein [Gemmataceae bacterium]
MTEFMVLVERAVRPVRSGPRRKMRMREELLAHLTGIYEQELARLGDEPAARAEAARRFGDPAGLTADLQAAVTVRDRIDHRLDRWFGWHPPESAARYTFRLAGLVGLILLALFLFALVVGSAKRPTDPSAPSSATLLRLWAAILLSGTAVVVTVGVLYFKIRASLFGAFGATRSQLRALRYAAVLLLAIPALSLGSYLVLLVDAPEAAEFLRQRVSIVGTCIGAILIPVFAVVYARSAGQGEIRHAEWSCLDIGR